MKGAFILAVLLPCAASAAGPQDLVKMLTFAQQECPIALNDPAQFLTKFSQTSTQAQTPVASSPDQSIFQISSVLDGYEITADWSDHGPQTMRHCTVTIGNDITNATGFDAVLRSWFLENTGTKLKGGKIPISYATGSGGTYTPNYYTRYVTLDAIPSPLGITFNSVEISDGYISFTVSLVHPTILLGE